MAMDLNARGEVEKVVLAHLGERARPITFSGGLENRRGAIVDAFRDILHVEDAEAELLLQVCSKKC